MRTLSMRVCIGLVASGVALSGLACGLFQGGGSGAGTAGSSEGQAPSAAPGSTSTQAGDIPAASAPTEPQTSGGGDCANTYFPVKQGATWSYDVTGGPSGTVSYGHDQ